MKLKKITITSFFVLSILVFSISCKAFIEIFDDNTTENESSNTEESTTNPSDNEENTTELINSTSYFWGTWTRMDNGIDYEISETEIQDCAKKSTYKITNSTDTTITSSLGIFTKKTDNVFQLNDIPFFRKQRANIEYKARLVGFTETSTRAATASSTAKGLSGIQAKVTSDCYSSYNQTVTSNEDGIITCTSPVSGTTNIINVTSSDGNQITVKVTPKNNGENIGTIPVTNQGQYSLKVTGEILKYQTENENDYLYGNNCKTYMLNVNIENTTNIKSRPGTYTISSTDSNLSISGELSGDIPSFSKESGTISKTVTVSYGLITKPYVDTAIKVTFEDADGNIWDDYISLRFFRGNVPISISAYSTDGVNTNATLNGFVIYPDGKNEFFSVNHNSTTTIFVPSFPEEEKYMLSFSGATSDGKLSESTEMFYTIGINQSAPIVTKTSDTDLGLQIYNAYEPNENETNATVLLKDNLEKPIYAYIEGGDIEFYSFSLCDYGFDYAKNSNYPKSISTSYISENSMLVSWNDDIGTSSSYTVMYSTDKNFEQNVKTVSTSSNKIMLDDVDARLIYYVRIKTDTSSYSPYIVTPKMNYYTISYNLNGGAFKNNNVKYLFFEKEKISLPLPSEVTYGKNDYVLAGWYTTADFQKDSRLIEWKPYEKKENITLYAKWVKGAVVTTDNVESVVRNINTTDVYRMVFEELKDSTIIFYKLNQILINSSSVKISLDLSLLKGVDSLTLFLDYLWLTEIQLPFGLKSIPNLAFSGCSELKSIEIPPSVTSIGESAFSGCSSLKSIKLPSEITSIGEGAFWCCTGLEHIDLPCDIQNIESSTFYYCSALKSIKLPSEITSIGEGAFWGCSELESIDLPSGIKKIESYTFYECSGLKSLTLPSELTSIDNKAFNGCEKLESINIPNTIKKIGSGAFSQTNINVVSGNISDWYYTSNSDYSGGIKTELDSTNIKQSYYWYKY